jgi:hypothetical protein
MACEGQSSFLKKLFMLDGALLRPTYLWHFCVTDHETVYVVCCALRNYWYIIYSRVINHVGC